MISRKKGQGPNSGKGKAISDETLVKCGPGMCFGGDGSTFHVLPKRKPLDTDPIPACGNRDANLDISVEAIPRRQVCEECFKRSNGGVVLA